MDKFLESMLEVFERVDINPEDEFRDYEEWDSLAYLSIIAMIDENYDIVIPGEEFSKSVLGLPARNFGSVSISTTIILRTF